MEKKVIYGNRGLSGGYHPPVFISKELTIEEVKFENEFLLAQHLIKDVIERRDLRIKNEQLCHKKESGWTLFKENGTNSEITLEIQLKTQTTTLKASASISAGWSTEKSVVSS